MSENGTETDRRILILYATETGNSLDASERIAREARRRHFYTTVASVDAYDSQDLLDEQLVIFVLSTTGSGEEPRPMKPFWLQLLRSDLPNDLFDEMAFTVFGLGDSAYERFCWASKKLVRRLLSLGAKEIVSSCHSDEQDRFGYETALMPWIETLFETLLKEYPIPESLNILPASQRPSPRARISMVKEGAVKDLLPLEPATRYYASTLVGNRRITAADWSQDVRHLVFRFDDDIEWSPGDIAILHPSNQPEDVQAILERFDWLSIADSPLNIISKSIDQPLPSHLADTTATLRELFTSVLDISCVPRKSFFEWLVHFTSDTLEKEKFEEFTSLTTDGQDDLYDYTHRVRRTILEVIQDFRYVSIPLDYLFDVFPLIRPRQFSIASSSRYAKSQQIRNPHASKDSTPKSESNSNLSNSTTVNSIDATQNQDQKQNSNPAYNASLNSGLDQTPNQGVDMELCVAIVNYRTKLRSPRRGLCTTWLAGLYPREEDGGNNKNSEELLSSNASRTSSTPIRIRVGLRKGALRLPVHSHPFRQDKDSNVTRKATPVICVGPGTGVAPMRAIIQERMSRGEKDNVLYFGCRKSNMDYYYSSEWESHAQYGHLTFSVAFSRDQESKVYVQDLVEQDSVRIWNMVEKEKAYVYISGSSNKMPAAVKAAIKKAAQTEGGLNENQADKYIADMEWQGRLFEECWS